MRINCKKEFLKWYTICFAIIIIIILAPVMIKGKTLVTDSDCFNQYYPVFVYIGKYIRECVSSLRLKQFDFTIGLGEGIIPALNYYGFGDPLNLISALIPEKYAPYGFSVLLIVRIYFCGISMAICCKKNKKSWSICLLAALTYSFSSFILIKGFQFYTYITAVMLLPLMIAGVNEILRGEKKISLYFILLIFFQAINGFYFLYMDTLFIFIYFLLFFNDYEKEWKKVWRIGGRLTAQYLLGLFLGAVILLPAVKGFVGSTRTGENVTTISKLLFFNNNIYKDYIGNFLIARRYSNGELAFLAVEVICLFMLWGVKGYRSWKIISAAALIGYFTPLAGYVMNGFAYPSDRWVFIIHFIMVMVMAEMLEIKEILRGKTAIAFIAVIIITMLTHEFNSCKGVADIFRILIYLFIEGMAFICFYYHKRKDFWIGILVGGNIILNGCMIFGPVMLGGGGYSTSFLSFDEIQKGFQRSLGGEIKQNLKDMCRADVYENSYGASMVLGYYGCAEYLSILNKNVSDFYQYMEISPGIRGSSWTLSGLDGRKAIEDILSVQYYAQPYVEEGKIKNRLMKNEDYLPFGYTYSSYITEEELSILNAPDRDTAILQAVVLECEVKGIPKIKTIEKATQLNTDINYENIEKNGELFETRDNSILNIQIKNPMSGEIYVKFSDLYFLSEFIRSMRIENKTIQLLHKDYQYQQFGRMNSDYWIKIDLEEYQKNVQAEFLAGQTYSLGGVEVYTRCEKKDSTYIEDLKENILENLSIGINKVEGTLRLNEEKILFLSVPYSSGWTAYVNGEKTEIYKANIGFCGLPLNAGNYEIVLEYRLPGLRVGFIISVIGCIILLLWTRNVKKEG